MPTAGKTKPIHVYEGVAAFILETKKTTTNPVWLILERNLTSDFVIKYNNWVRNNPTAVDAQGKKFKEIERDGW